MSKKPIKIEKHSRKRAMKPTTDEQLKLVGGGFEIPTERIGANHNAKLLRVSK